MIYNPCKHFLRLKFIFFFHHIGFSSYLSVRIEINAASEIVRIDENLFFPGIKKRSTPFLTRILLFESVFIVFTGLILEKGLGNFYVLFQ